MKLNFGLQLQQTQKLVMTPELRQAIEILQLSSLELNNLIAEELEKNPVLDIQEDAVDGKPKEQEEKADSKTKEEIDWEQYFENNQSYYGESSFSHDDQEYNQENFVKDSTTLKEHLLFQLHISLIDAKHKKIGEYIIECIDNNGYLTTDTREIASILKEDISDVENILTFIQEFEPSGVAARDIKECLSIQLKHHDYWNEKIQRIIDIYLEDLANNRFQTISKDLGLSFKEIQDIKDFIRTLEPKPGRIFSSDQDVGYVVPDAYVEKVDNEYIIIVNDSTAPRLQISNFYRNILKNESKSSTTSKYLNEKLDSAMWLIKSIEQRRNTLYNVISVIVDMQKDFFEMGIHALKPLVLKDVAEKLEIHESTVSRATNGKYVQTPRGVFELKYFFNSGIEKKNGDAIASEGIKDMIKNIIAEENPQKPISDQDIANTLKTRGVSISRRTVAKYRDEMRIMSSSKRKRFN
ncbi:RNA polymerase factor sigma-54 [Irregularibacter muris]|uniref:RNA polymerase factor sigma-54 n=1 Tax=Irregularibacter muris TaxID=1796619 RepID=A0AAE3HD10_9FIRM|nr:RNA polymerase factor sigma-54 [Irregularibacter muris]MCR1897611.1 RNA polymerase factor sigma-54 [Irregularibacter muris]